MSPSTLLNSPLPIRLAAGIGLVVCVLLSVVPPSTSRVLIWPWSLVSVGFWGIACFLGAAALLGRARFPYLLEKGLLWVAIAAVASAFSSPFRGIALPATWIVVGACLLPLACLPWFGGERRSEAFVWTGWAVLAVLVSSIGGWAINLVLPAIRRGGTVFRALSERNDQPFGHANYNAAFGLLALGWMAACLAPWLASHLAGPHRTKAVESPTPRLRGEWVLGCALALLMLVTSGSRAGVGALALGLVTGVFFFWRYTRPLSRRTRIFVLLAVTSLLAVGTLTNGRLRALILDGSWNATASESNQQRLGMTQGALLLGADRPFLGWGSGAVPQVFPSVRARVAGTVDNVIQVHSSALQTWATLGSMGAVGAGAIAIGTFGLLRRSQTSPCTPAVGFERAALGGGIVSYAAFSFFDHSLDIPALAALAAASLAALATSRPNSEKPAGPRWTALALLAGVVLVPGVIRDQQARRQHSLALDAAEKRDANSYEKHLAAASKALPDAAYLDHQRASLLATGEPFGLTPSAAEKDKAAALLLATLDRNPNLEYAHYNLGWLLLDARPTDAERHFSLAARLAPHRLGVHLGLGLARASLGNAGGAVRSFAAERINAPEQAFASLFRDASLADLARDVDNAALEFLQRAVREKTLPAASVDAVFAAWASVPTIQVQESAPFRRVRPGYGVLMGFPEGRPPVDFNAMTSLALSTAVARTLPKPGWVPGWLLLDLSLGPTPDVR